MTKYIEIMHISGNTYYLVWTPSGCRDFDRLDDAMKWMKSK